MDLKQRLLSKIDELNEYLEEIDKIKPQSFEEYNSSIEKKRACERLLQVLIEVVIDISYLLYKYNSLGIPKCDTSVIKELYKKKIINKKIRDLLRNMNAFRNILVHKYGTIDDELVFENLQENMEDFEILKGFFLKKVKK